MRKKEQDRVIKKGKMIVSTEFSGEDKGDECEKKDEDRKWNDKDGEKGKHENLEEEKGREQANQRRRKVQSR